MAVRVLGVLKRGAFLRSLRRMVERAASAKPNNDSRGFEIQKHTFKLEFAKTRTYIFERCSDFGGHDLPDGRVGLVNVEGA